MAGIVLEGVSRTFPDGVTAVRDLCLEVRDRELLVIVGPSGCGKSTTLRMIAGLEEPSAGEIHIGSRVMNRVPPKDRNIAMVFQNYALYPHLSVYRNLSFALELRRSTGWLKRSLMRVVQPRRAAEIRRWRAEIDQRVRDAAKLLGIESLLERMPAQLSGGERQRVALGRAIVRQPVAFLFDEPLSNLDARLRVQMRRELKALHARLDTTMVYVTHDQVEALTLGDRVVVMHEGTVQQFDNPMEVYSNPSNRFVAGFIGSPGANFVEGRLERTGENLRFTGDGWALPVDRRVPEGLKPYLDQVVVFGIRPENVVITGVDVGSGCRARITAVEPLGDATIVHVVPEGHEEATPLVAKVASSPPLARNSGDQDSENPPLGTVQSFCDAPSPGTPIAVQLDARQGFWFDPANGGRIDQ